MVISFKPSEAGVGLGQALANITAQFVGAGLLGALAGGVISWLVGSTLLSQALVLGLYIFAMAVALSNLRYTYPHSGLGLCNGATIARLVLACVLITSLLSPNAPPWPIFSIALIAFAFDGLDGWLARREGLTSAFGARFDMEVDSILALVLALLAWQSGSVGVYVILLGLPRYVFWVAQRPLPWLNGDLPERFSRKFVCVIQISALILALLPPVPSLLAQAMVVIAALAVAWSFARDALHLWRYRA